MKFVQDVILPEPRDCQRIECIAAYRVARKAALFALQYVRREADRLDELADQLQVKYAPRKPYPEEAVRMAYRLQLISINAGHYRQRLAMLRAYMRYVRKVHGQA